MAFSQRGTSQGQIAHQQNRYENQQGPLANTMAFNYGRGTETDYANQQDIMDRYRSMAPGGTSSGGATGFGASHIGYTDPFNSYAGYQDFSKTGGYDRNDIANMRSRAVSPIRAAYANAGREVGRQRSLQGGYAPNAIATMAKMAREQSQGMSDATQNTEAQLAQMRNAGRQFGLQGMTGVETSRLGADLDVGKFNASADMAAGASGSAASQANQASQLAALHGMSQLYGTTPGMSNMFGNQVSNIVGQGGNFGLGMAGAMNNAQTLPGAWDTTMKGVGQVANMAYPWLDAWRKKQPNGGMGGGTMNTPPTTQYPNMPSDDAESW